MKTLYPLVSLLTSLLLFSCNSSENKVDQTIKNKDTLATVHEAEAHAKDNVNRQNEVADESTVNLVKLRLRKMFKEDLDKNLIDEQSRKFRVFEHNINKDPKKEIFVGLTGPYFCGSGGCTVLLLDPQGELITKFTVTENPILIADTFTKEWSDLILHSQGKDHLVKFNGNKYPSNPSIQPVYSSSSSQNPIKGLDSADQSYSW